MPSKDILLRWTLFALDCLNEIYEYIFVKEKSPDAAKVVIDKIFQKVEQLKNFPESGQQEPLLNEIGQDSRYLLEFSYKIIYEFHQEDRIIIITDVSY